MNRYAYIILTAILPLSTTCMERERKTTDPLNIQSPSSIVRPANSSLYSMSTLNDLLQPNPFPIPVIQRKYTDLDITPVYVPINTNEASNTNDIELTPLYRPIEGSTTEYFDCITKTKRVIPLTNAEKNDLINQLYQAASGLYISSYSDVSIHNHQELVKLIILMKKAKQHNITEDVVGLFTYQHVDYSKYRSLFFNCLKKYNNTEEELPFNTDDLHINPSLAQALNIACKYQSIEDINDRIKSYPAYTNLIDKFRKIIGGGHNALYKCFYLDTQILFDDYPQYNYVTDFDSFYTYVHG